MDRTVKFVATIFVSLMLGYFVAEWFGDFILALILDPIFPLYLISASLIFMVFRREKMNEIAMARMLALLNQIAKVLESIDQSLSPEGTVRSLEFYLIKDGVKTKVDKMFMKVQAVADLAVAFKDKNGNPAKVDGAPKWALTNEALGSLVAAEDGMSATFTAGSDAAQVGKIQVFADADLGEGVKEIIGELDIELAALDAEVVEITATVRP